MTFIISNCVEFLHVVEVEPNNNKEQDKHFNHAMIYYEYSLVDVLVLVVLAGSK